VISCHHDSPKVRAISCGSTTPGRRRAIADREFQNPGKKARDVAPLHAAAIGAARAGVIETSFAKNAKPIFSESRCVAVRRPHRD